MGKSNIYRRIATAVPAAVVVGLIGCVELPEFTGGPIVTTESLPEATGATDYPVTLEAVGGQEPYRWSAVDLAPGLALSADGEIAGSPRVAGDFDAIVVVADANGATDVAAFPLTVTANPTIAASQLPPIHVLRAYDEVVDVLGGTPPYEVELAQGPAGMAFEFDGAGDAHIVRREALTDVSPGPLELTVTDAEGVSGSVSPELAVVGLSAIAPGGTHVCALDADARAWCWGANGKGQLGDGGAEASPDTRGGPITVGVDRAFSSITAGRDHTCALDEDGGAWCWGDNSHGQLGRCDEVDPDGGGCADPAASAEPEPVDGAADLVAIAAGSTHTCALEASGDVLCWGNNSAGRLGNDDLGVHSPTPVRVALDEPATAISVSSNHACALVESGDALCWGRNANDQLGLCEETTDGSGNTVCDPRKAAAAPIAVETELQFQAIAAGNKHTCGIGLDGVTWCWGTNGRGQLGDGTNDLSREPVAVDPESGGDDAGFVQLAAGHQHTCAVDGAGQVHCWGANDVLQLGRETEDAEPQGSPVPVSAAVEREIDLIESTREITCAIEPSGDAGAIAWCWGREIGLPAPAAEGYL